MWATRHLRVKNGGTTDASVRSGVDLDEVHESPFVDGDCVLRIRDRDAALVEFSVESFCQRREVR